MTGALRRHWWFWAGFAGAILLIAGVASYFASSSPDGLDSATCGAARSSRPRRVRVDR
jgi:cobalt/nickel transport protein